MDPESKAKSVAQPSRKDGSTPVLDGQGKVPVLRYVIEIVQLAAAQKWPITAFMALYFLASFVQMGGLLFFNAGFSIVGADASSKPDRVIRVVGHALTYASIPHGSWWVIFFSAFVLLSLGAAAMDHWGRVIRLKLLGVYEANQVSRGLKMLCQSDPRELSGFSRREMTYALRGDCKSMRVVFQIILQTVASVIQIVFPFIYIFTMDVSMSLVGLGTLLLGAYPVYVLGRKSGRMTFSRQEMSVAAGMQVSSMISGVQDGAIASRDKQQAIDSIRAAVEDQLALWRQQYQIRSLCEKIPTAFSLLGTFAILLMGVVKIRDGTLSWPALMTFVVATRIVFGPFSGMGGRVAKASEYLLRAGRHLNFIARFLSLAKAQKSKPDLPVVGGRVRIDSIQFKDLVLPHAPESDLPPLNLDLRPGSIVALVDPKMGLRNPLFQLLTGTRYVTKGDILLNGRSINSLRYEAIQNAYSMTRIGSGGQGYSPGTLLECLRTFEPHLTREQAEAFAVAVLGQELYDSIPAGLDTFICYETRKKGIVPLPCFWLITLFRKHKEAKTIQVVDAFEELDGTQWTMMERFMLLYRREHIFFWMDRGLRRDIPWQHVLVFRNGLWLGAGDVEWFDEHFSDWEAGVAVRGSRAAEDLEDVLAEEMEEEELEEDA